MMIDSAFHEMVKQCSTVGEQWAHLMNRHLAIPEVDITPHEAWLAMEEAEAVGYVIQKNVRYPDGNYRTYLDTEDFFALARIVRAGRKIMGRPLYYYESWPLAELRKVDMTPRWLQELRNDYAAEAYPHTQMSNPD